MAKGKVDAKVSTGIGIDTAGAVQSINQLENAVKGATNEWKQLESQQKRSGDELGSAETKFKGLSNAVDKQQNVLGELKRQQAEVNRETSDGEKTYQQYESQITSAERKLTSMTGQLDKAHRAYQLEESGINSLNRELQQHNKEVDAHVDRLKAEGKETEANEYKRKGLATTIEKQTKLYEAQVSEMKRLESSNEASADSISKQKIALDKTAGALAKSKSGLENFDKAQSEIGKNEGASVAGGKFEKFTGKIGKTKAGLIAMGATATTILAGVAKAVDKVFDAQGEVNTLQAKTTLSYGKSKESILALNKLYANGYGESMDELNETYAQIAQMNPHKSVKELAEDTKLVSTYAKLSGSDSQEVMQGADRATKAWHISYKEYFDNMTMLQKRGDDVGGDLSDNMQEYSQVLGQMGFSIKDSMSLIDNGIKSGAYNGDKLLDFTKEFSISLNDGRMDKAIGSFSKKSQEMFAGYKNGKVSASDMFKQITGEMGKMTDKQKEATLASNLWSALGEDNSLKVIDSLGKTNKGFDDVKGTADKTAKQLKEQNPFELLKRGAESSTTALAMSTGQTKKFKGALKPMQKAINELLKATIKAMPGIMKALTPVIEFISKHGKLIVGVLGSILAIKFGAKIVSSVTGILNILKPLFLLLTANPIGLIVTGISLVVVALVELYKHNKTFKKFVNGVVEACADFFKGIGKWFGKAWKTISGFFKKVLNFVKSDWKEILLLIVNPFAGAFALVYKHNAKFRKSIDKLVKDVKGFFKGIGKSIGNGADVLVDWFKGLTKGFKKGWNAFVKGVVKLGKFMIKSLIIAIAFPVGIAMMITEPLIKPLKKIFNTLVKDVKKIWTSLTTGLKKIFNTFTRDAKKIWNGFTKVLKAIFTPVINFWKSEWNTIVKFFGKIWKVIDKVFTNYLNNLKKNLTTALNFISKNWNKIWNAVSKTFKKIWKSIKAFFTPIIKWLHSIISSTLNKIYSGWKNTWNKISSFFSNIWKSMKRTGHDAIWSIKNTFDSVLSKIHKAFSDTWKKIKSGFSNMWDGMKDLAEKGINAVIKIPNKGITGINGLIHDFGGPKHAISKIPKVHFATGTGMFNNQRKAITKPTLATLNDGNDSPETNNQEMLIHPNGASELVQGRNTQRILGAGTEVLNATETAMLLGMKPMAFKSGTGFWSGVFDKVTNVAGNAWNGLKNGVKKFTEMFKFITGAVAHPVKTLEGKFNPNADGLAGFFDSFGNSMFKKPKSQAKGWWKTLWSMASEASSSGASAGNKGDDYRFKNRVADSGNGDPWGYFFKECVSFVASRLANMGVPASKFSHLGNGSQWTSAPVRHTSHPKPGMVAVYSNGSQFGNHVAMVNGVQGDSISGEEYNYNYNHKYHTYKGRPISGATTFLDFGLSGGAKAPEVKANSPMAKLIKRQTGGMMKWIQKFISPLNDEDGSVGGGTQALPSGSHKHWLEQAGINGNFDKWNYIINHESSWNPRAKNPSSDAYGIGQALPPSKMASFGSDYMSNPITQLKWMKSYVNGRYGGINEAYRFWQRNHWYENGGLINQDSIIRVAEHNKPEMIIPLDNKPRANELLSQATERVNGRQQENNLLSELINVVKSGNNQGGDTYEININVNADTTQSTINKISQAVEDAITRKQNAKSRAFG